MKRRAGLIHVHGLPTRRTLGRLVIGATAYPCVLGRSGIVVDKREGDGGTPRARLPLRRVFQRLDKAARIPTLLAMRAIRHDDAWCDDPSDRRYNRLIRRPPDQAEERLSRADRLYDVIVELGWNDAPVRRGRGSAIFWHVCREARTPTAGCVAVEPDVFRKILPRLSRRAVMVVR
jgi:L,D-peptidoglycan transpeptidase YkuD (ErfK/YbiS/YcfS/YnhG family)